MKVLTDSKLCGFYKRLGCFSMRLLHLRPGSRGLAIKTLTPGCRVLPSLHVNACLGSRIGEEPQWEGSDARVGASLSGRIESRS